MRKLQSLIVTAALCVLTGTACGRVQPEPQAAPTSIVVVDQAGYGKELRENHDTFRWPPDFRPDVEKLIDATRPQPEEKVQAGVSRTVLAVVNSCAWYLSWDAAASRGDDAASAEALRIMTDVLTTFPPSEDPVGKEFVVQAAVRAKSGDPGPARQYVAANCPETAWIPISPK